MTGVKRDNELSQLLKWGDFMMKIGEMECWKALEVLTGGKTIFFTPRFGNTFCGLVENDEGIAKYVLETLTHGLKSDGKWLKRVMEATPAKIKNIVKTLVLQWKVGEAVIRSQPEQADHVSREGDKRLCCD
jgi:hypothetical protein